MDFSDVVSEFHALLVFILLLMPIFNQLIILRHFLVIIINLLLRIRLIHRCKKVDEDGLAASNLGLDAGLYDLYSFPVFVIGSTIKILDKLSISENSNLLTLLVSNDDCI